MISDHEEECYRDATNIAAHEDDENTAAHVSVHSLLTCKLQQSRL